MKHAMKKVFTCLVSAGLILSLLTTPVMAQPAKLTGHGKTVKNVILLISDGWGYNQILATDYFTTGKAGTQAYEKFPTKLAMSTYSLENQGDGSDDGSYDPTTIWDHFDNMKIRTTDSAAAGTAMSTGTKTYDAAIGVDNEAKDLVHIAQDFEALGRSTGVVSSVQFSHATPASFVAHHGNRNDYAILANEMLKDSATDVIMGAGHPLYTDNAAPNATIAEKNYRYVGGSATWNALLDGTLSVADADGDGVADPWTLIQSEAQFRALQSGETPDRVVGVPQVATTLQQARSGNDKASAYEVAQNKGVPSLAVMTKGALNVLDNNEEGFFLMVEGGAVDWAGHANQSGRVIEEQDDFNDAVDAVLQWVNHNSNWNETLVIVTGDHETGYLTGSTGVYGEVVNQGKGNMPIMAWNSGDHTNQLIPLFAKGAGAEIFKKLADEKDPVHGNYLDNTELVLAIRALID